MDEGGDKLTAAVVVRRLFDLKTIITSEGERWYVWWIARGVLWVLGWMAGDLLWELVTGRSSDDRPFWALIVGNVYLLIALLTTAILALWRRYR